MESDNPDRCPNAILALHGVGSDFTGEIRAQCPTGNPPFRYQPPAGMTDYNALSSSASCHKVLKMRCLKQ